MAGLTVETKLRPCYAFYMGKEVKALFHGWCFFSQPIGASPLVGGHPGGVVADTKGIVELEDGRVELCHPLDIRFIDSNFDEYIWDEKEREE